MACHPEYVTGYVDAELSPRLEQDVARHLSCCPICAGQAAFEIDLRESLRSSAIPLPADLAVRVQAAARADARLRAH